MKRARQILRAKKLVVSPHTARKMWAVEQTKNGKDIRKLQKLMNHSDPSITMVYAMADEITRRKCAHNFLAPPAKIGGAGGWLKGQRKHSQKKSGGAAKTHSERRER